MPTQDQQQKLATQAQGPTQGGGGGPVATQHHSYTKPKEPTVEIMPNLPAPVRFKDAMSALKPLGANLEKGELDLTGIEIGARLAAFQEFQEKINCNLPLWEASLLCQMPKGTTLVVIPVTPTRDDAWHGEQAKDIKLRPGMVEPTADFLNKLASLLNVQFEFSAPPGVDDSTGTKMYEVLYNAYTRLPSGQLRSVTGEGKAAELYTNSGSKQAHIKENVRTKAKRNAIKKLLDIPTQVREEDFYRTWLLLKPVFRPEDEEGIRILAEDKMLDDRARAMLFSQPLAALPSANSSSAFESLKAALESADNAADLSACGEAIAAVTAQLAGNEIIDLRKAFKARKALIENGEVTQA